PVTGRNRQLEYRDGRVGGEFATVQAGRFVRTVIVNFASHDWITNKARLPFVARAETNEAATSAQANRDNVANGRAAIVGRGIVDGRQALHLHQVQTFPAPTALFRRPPPITIDTWVDRLTYVTLRTRSGIQGHVSTSVESWLPRTPANVAKTRLVIPRGFTHKT